MDLQYHVDQTFEATDFAAQSRLLAEYESCLFKNCTFLGMNISESRFIDCDFRGCDLSNAQLYQTVFRDVQCKECKMLGLPFEKCKDLGFSISFDDCQLDHSTFYEMKLRHCSFRNCHLHSVDFGRSDLEGVVLTHCDLQDALFENTNLKKADLTGSHYFSIDPEGNQIKGANFSLSQVVRLLDKYQLRIDRGS